MSDSDSENITYQFTFPDGSSEEFVLEFDSDQFLLKRHDEGPLPSWTELEFEKCSHCPLNSAEHPNCPLAASLVRIVEATDKLFSYDEVKVEVTLPQRHVSADTTAQKGISSLMGLIIPASGCPYSAYFRPMARFHLPFSDENDTIYRVTSMYLLALHVKNLNGVNTPYSLDGLSQIYENMRIVNTAIAERLRSVTEKDSSLNAIVLLDMFTLLLPLSIESSLEEIKHLFKPFLEAQDI